MSKEVKKNKLKTNELQESFLKFLFNKDQKFQLIIFFVFYVILYFLMIHLNPFPASISDSGAYVNAAFLNRIDTYRPFGYSQFLIKIHALSTSVHFLVAAQYFINVICTLFFIFSIKFHFKPNNKLTFYLFAFFAIFSPLSIYLTNTILSDSLFTSLTILWITTGLWLLFNRENYSKYLLYIVHLILLFFLINIRYTGLIYLPLSILLVYLVFYRQNLSLSILLALIPILLVFGYYNYQKNKIYQLSRVNTFSGFSGWQLANNALHCIPDINLDISGIEDKQVKEFAQFVVFSKNSLKLVEKPSAKFMWDKELPLKKYCFYEADRTKSSYAYQWNYLGEYVYKKFGSYVIKKYPITFAKNYLIPNSWAALYPVHDQIVKHFRVDGIPENLMRDWFKLPDSEKVTTRSKVFEKTFFLIPISRLIIWIGVIAVFIIYLFKRKQIQWQPHQQSVFVFILVFTSIYFAFNVYASPFELRYIAPIHLMQLTLIFIITNSLNINFLNLKNTKN